MRLLRTGAVLLALAALSACTHLPCFCDDDEVNPRRSGLDGRSSAQLAPDAAPREDPALRDGLPVAPSTEEERS